MIRGRIPYAPAGVVAQALDYFTGSAGQSGAAQDNPHVAGHMSDEEARQAIIAQAEASNDPAEQERLGRALFALSGEQRAPTNNREADARVLEQIWRGQRAQQGPPGMASTEFLDYQNNFQSLLLNPDPITAEGAVAQVTGATSEFEDAVAKLGKTRALQGAMDLAAINKALSDPGVTEAQRADVEKQWMQKYPELAAQGMKPRPMSKEQAAAMMRQVRVQQANDSALMLLRGETPEQLVFENDKGELEVPPGISEALRIRGQDMMVQRQMQSEQLREQRERLKIQLDLLEAEKPAEPGMLADGSALAQYQAQLAAWNERKRRLLQSQAGGVPAPSQPASPYADPAPAAAPANVSFGSGDEARAAFAAGTLRPGMVFHVRNSAGQFVPAVFDENGRPGPAR